MTKRNGAAVMVAILVLALNARVWASIASGPYLTFVAESRPEPPLESFVAGQLGLIEPSWNTDYLYVVYRYLAGPGFDPDEQKVLLTIFNPSQSTGPDPLSEENWILARAQVPDAPELATFDVFAATGQYESFRNCNDDAFRAANATLQSMIAKFGRTSAQVKEWLSAQDIVFQNCPGSKGHPHIPEPLQGGTPLEQAQRAYQIACANFYGEDFDTAIKLFTAISDDPISPWRELAPYLIARATTRKATLSGDTNDPALLALAAQRFKAIIAGKNPENIKAAAQRLLRYVECRLHPEQAHAQIARALMKTNSSLTLAEDLHEYGICGTVGRETDRPADDLDAWIEIFQSSRSGRGQAVRLDSPDPPRDTSYSVGKWKRTGSLAWLVAALAEISGTDPNVGPLLDAAQRVKPESSAYLTLEFQSDRILIQQGKRDEARDRIDAVLTSRKALGRSAYNEFASMRLKLARDPDEFLKYALRYPVALEGDDYFEYPAEGKGFENISIGPEHTMVLGEGPLLGDDSTEIMDAWLPVSMLKQFASNPILPLPLRADVAVSVWVRAIVLGDTPAARELAPIVSELIPPMKAPLDRWLAAKSGDEERFEAALIMLRNPGSNPYVASGESRELPLDKMDHFRSNWWTQMAAVVPEVPPTPPAASFERPQLPRYPSFLSEAERKAADREWAALSVITGAEFLCTEAIHHAKTRPDDARVPEALNRCIYAVHLSQSDSRCDALAETAFNTLHRQYPDSEWARKNHFWYRADKLYPHPAGYGR